MLKNVKKQKNKQKQKLVPLVPHPRRNTTNSSGVQSDKTWPSFNADQSKKSERANILLSRDVARNLSLVQWCRIIIELSFGLISGGLFTSCQLTCSSYLQCAFLKRKKS